MIAPAPREAAALERLVAQLEDENDRLRELVAALRRDSAEGRDLMRQEVRKCSYP